MNQGASCRAILVATLVLAAGPAPASPRITIGGPGSPGVVTAVPNAITFQAFLEENGVPITGDVTLTLEFFNVAAGGIPLFPAVNVNVVPDDGVVSVSVPVPEEFFFDKDRYLQVTVDGQTVMPRLQIESTPFSFHSALSDSVRKQPGVASATRDGSMGIPIGLVTNSFVTLDMQTITAPTNGFCLVIATCEAKWSHTNGTTDTAIFGVSNEAGDLPAGNQDVTLQLDGNHRSSTMGGEKRPVTVHGLFNCLAGANTFYFNAFQLSGTFTVEDVQLTLVFLPEGLGTVELTENSAAHGPPTEGDLR